MIKMIFKGGLMRTLKTNKEKIFSKVDISNVAGCWLWNGTKDSSGYGQLTFDKTKNNIRTRKTVQATRIVWEEYVGNISKDMLVCHTCDNPGCVRPDHLFLGTAKDNMRDMAIKIRGFWQKKTHCKRGHEYNQENTYKWKMNTRDCRICQRIRSSKGAL